MSNNKQTSLVEGALSVTDVIRNVDESKVLPSNNHSFGFSGEAKSYPKAKLKWDATFKAIASTLKYTPKEVRALLDSKWGRWLAIDLMDGKALKDRLQDRKFQKVAQEYVNAYRKNPEEWDESVSTAQDRGLTLDEADLSITDVMRNVADNISEASLKTGNPDVPEIGFSQGEFYYVMSSGLKNSPAIPPAKRKNRKYAETKFRYALRNEGQVRDANKLIDKLLKQMGESVNESSVSPATGLTLDS